MKNSDKTVLTAGLRMFAVFFAIELFLEFVSKHFFDVSVKDILPNTAFGPLFVATYFFVTAVGLLLMIYVYVLLRPRFTSRLRTGLITCGIFFAYTSLLFGQLLNFGFVTQTFVLVSLVFNGIELPIVLTVGILSMKEEGVHPPT